MLNLIGKNERQGKREMGGRFREKRKTTQKTITERKSTRLSHLKVLGKCRLQEKGMRKKTVTAGPSYGSVNTTNEINIYTSNKAGR